MNSNTLVPHDCFLALTSKYSVSIPEKWKLEFCTENACAEKQGGVSLWCIQNGSTGCIPLFPWRSERRFIELQRIVDTKTLEDVVLCRFSCVTDNSSTLNRILYQEFDLLEWIIGSPIVSVSAATNGNQFSNVLVRLENGTIASVEAGTTLPTGTETLDRHELIARRGVASDRVVDTHIPQQSVYLFDKNGVQSWTDTDAELFGLSNGEIDAVRAAFELAKNPAMTESNITRHKHLLELVQQLNNET
ncbi:MAG: hypothetical protein FWE67_03565 [Planctomycetaceae bacterium]|nr:hypothetical protein [Planctomycetaceae bacterium]